MGTAEDKAFVFERMSGIARFIYEAGCLPTTEQDMYYLSLSFCCRHLFISSDLLRKLRLLQNVVIYLFLFIGCLVLTFLAFFLPIVEGLIVAALILIIYRVRRMNEHKTDKTKDSIA